MAEQNTLEGLSALEKRFDTARNADQIDDQSIWGFRRALDEILADKGISPFRLPDNLDNPDLLRVLAKLEVVEGRQRVAQHQNTPQDVLGLLADDPSDEVVINVAYNKNTSTETLTKLASHRNAEVRKGLASNSRASHVHQALLKDPEVGVRFNLAFTSEDPTLLRSLAEDDAMPPHVMTSIASNKHTPLDILEDLADVADEDCGGFGAVARNNASKNPTYIAAHPA